MVIKKGEFSDFKTNPDTHYTVSIVKESQMPLLKTIISTLSYALFIFLLLIGVTLLIYVLNIHIKRSRGDMSSPTYNAFVVLSGSMLPKIHINDIIITKKVAVEKIKENDIITFYSSDSRSLGVIITHRVMGITKNNNQYKFITKGDNNNIEDDAMALYENVIGKVIFNIPKVGYIQTFLTYKGGWIFVILIPSLIIVSYDIMKLLKKLSEKKLFKKLGKQALLKKVNKKKSIKKRVI